MTEERVRLIGRRSALLAKVRAIANDVRGDDPTRRVHLVVSIDRFLQRLLATTDWGAWVLKGGYANQLRHPAEARFTEDVDLRIDADIDSATDMITTAARLDLDDPFPVLAGDRTQKWSPKTRSWSKVATQGRRSTADRPRST